MAYVHIGIFWVTYSYLGRYVESTSVEMWLFYLYVLNFTTCGFTRSILNPQRRKPNLILGMFCVNNAAKQTDYCYHLSLLKHFISMSTTSIKQKFTGQRTITYSLPETMIRMNGCK